MIDIGLALQHVKEKKLHARSFEYSYRVTAPLLSVIAGIP